MQEENDYVSQYVTEITVTKDGGLPAPNYNVTITADEEGTIQCASQSHDLVAGQPLTLTTDMMGRLRITSVATGVHTARLSVQGDWAHESAVDLSAAGHARLSRRERALPGEFTFTKDGSALVSAKSQTGSAFADPVTMSQGLDGDTAKTVAGTSIDIFAMKPSASSARSALRVRGPATGRAAGSAAAGRAARSAAGSAAGSAATSGTKSSITGRISIMRFARASSRSRASRATSRTRWCR